MKAGCKHRNLYKGGLTRAGGGSHYVGLAHQEDWLTSTQIYPDDGIGLSVHHGLSWWMALLLATAADDINTNSINE